MVECVYATCNPSLHLHLFKLSDSIVETLQPQLWSGQFEQADFLESVRTARHVRGQPAYEFASRGAGRKLFDSALALNHAWQAAPYYGSLTLDFPALT